MKIISYHRRANYYETDQMGIVHHTNYIRYFEEARIDFMRQIGCDCRQLEQAGAIIPVVDAYARYHKSLRFDDEFVVDIRLERFNGVRMEFSYEIHFARTGELAVTGHTSHCFVDAQQKPFSVKHRFPEIYRRMMSALSPQPVTA